MYIYPEKFSKMFTCWNLGGRFQLILLTGLVSGWL